MKTIYSLQEFYDEVLALAKQKSENYAHVKVEISSHDAIIFGCYVHRYNWEFGKTMEESIQKQRDKMFPPAPANIDVEIEMPTPVPEPTLPIDTTTDATGTATVPFEPIINTINP